MTGRLYILFVLQWLPSMWWRCGYKHNREPSWDAHASYTVMDWWTTCVNVPQPSALTTLNRALGIADPSLYNSMALWWVLPNLHTMGYEVQYVFVIVLHVFPENKKFREEVMTYSTNMKDTFIMIFQDSTISKQQQKLKCLLIPYRMLSSRSVVRKEYSRCGLASPQPWL